MHKPPILTPTGLTVRMVACPECDAQPRKMCRWPTGADGKIGKAKAACMGRYAVLAEREREIRERRGYQ